MTNNHKDNGGALSRRAAIAVIAGGGLLGITAAGAFEQVSASRNFGVGVSNATAIVGIADQGPVKRNSRETMVTLTNNTTQRVMYTITLSSCSDGTLYNNEGGSGCSVSRMLNGGNQGTIDIAAATTGTINYEIRAVGSSFTVETTGSVEAETGNIVGAVVIRRPVNNTEFTAELPQASGGNQFEIRNVDIRSRDGDSIVGVDYVVQKAGTGGTVVASKSVSFAPTGRYNPKGNPAETVTPNSGYTIQAGHTYILTVTGRDIDGNTATSTVEDTP